MGLRSYSEPWLDTSRKSPVGDLILNILASFAQFERVLIAERVRAGMEHARRQGKRLGRPKALNGEWERVRPLVEDGTMSQQRAAEILGIGRSTIGRFVSRKSSTATKEHEES